MRNYSAVDSLFVKKFRTKNNFYVYSVYSNEILSVGEEIYNSIEDYRITDDNNCISELVSNGILGFKRPEIIAPFRDIRKLRTVFEDQNCQQLILNLTNQCNMRCRYCTFSGNYKHERVHEDKHMSEDVALKAVDFFLQRSDSREKRAVTFYGGEVLTQYGLLRRVVDYVREADEDIEISFTTNGTLLTESVADFLIENSVGISVSLDGDRDANDTNRLLSGGQGSYDLIMENLKRIKRKSPEFFNSRVSFVSVLTPPYKFDRVKAFFYESDFFNKEKTVVVSPVSLHETNLYSKDEISFFSDEFQNMNRKVLATYEEALKKSDIGNYKIEKKWFEDIITQIHFRLKDTVENSVEAAGQCVPGLRRLFVNTEGKFFMCERVGEHLCIGDVYKGFDLKVIADFFAEWESFFRKCGSCWGARICDKCFAEFHSNGEFDESRREKYCDSALQYYERLLETYCRVLEENPAAFNEFRVEDYF